MIKAIVLFSGGLDSTVCLAKVLKTHVSVCAVNVYYGQRHRREIESSINVARHYDVERYEFDLSSCFLGCQSSLIKNSCMDVPCGTYHEYQNFERLWLSTIVPFRNGLFISAAASFSLGLFPDDEIEIFLANHAGDVENHEYADCSNEFINKMSEAVHEGTDGRACVTSLFSKMKKSDIVAEGLKLNVPFELTWSCYNGGDKPCCTCPACIQRADAFKANCIKDPLLD